MVASSEKSPVICYNSCEGNRSMTRINVDKAAPAVKKFIQSLAIDANGVEVILGGKVVCKIIPSARLPDVEKAAQLAEVRRLLSEARENSKRLTSATIERSVRNAAKAVRKGR
jgi:hypothetical protein